MQWIISEAKDVDGSAGYIVSKVGGSAKDAIWTTDLNRTPEALQQIIDAQVSGG